MPPGDDAAVLSDASVWTVDTMVEGVHWNERLSPFDVGWKLVAVSVSDLAAMGAVAREMLLAASLPPDHTEASPFWTGFCAGLAAAARAFDVTLAGGDTTRSPGPTVLSLSMGGRCPAHPLRRDAGADGDDLWVSGTLGLAGAGWWLSAPPEAALHALRRPEPRASLGVALAGLGVRCAMDLSDGLAADLPRLCAASRLGAHLDPDALPAHPAIADLPDRRALQLAGGEDYELLFAAPPALRDAIADLAAALGVPLTRVGALTAAHAGPVLTDGSAWPASLFAHFPGSRP